MNPWLFAAGIAAILLDFVHIFMGGREIHRPMVASHWPEPAKAVWSVVWHGITAVMALGGAILLVAAYRPDEALALSALPVGLFLSFVALFLFYSWKRLGSIWILPQWIGFVVVTALAIIGLAI